MVRFVTELYYIGPWFCAFICLKVLFSVEPLSSTYFTYYFIYECAKKIYGIQDAEFLKYNTSINIIPNKLKQKINQDFLTIARPNSLLVKLESCKNINQYLYRLKLGNINEEVTSHPTNKYFLTCKLTPSNLCDFCIMHFES